MDRATADELSARLYALLIEVEGRLTDRSRTFVHEFIDVGEFGLALETMSEMLAEGDRPVSSAERAKFAALVERIEMDDRVERSLALCPSRP